MTKYFFKIFNLLIFFTFYFLLFTFPAFAAKLPLDPLDKVLTSGEQFTVNLSVDTEGKLVNNLDITLTYPSNLIWVDRVDYSAAFPLHVDKILRSDGKITLHFGADSQRTRVNGQGWLATLTLSTHAAGDAYLSFACDNSNNNDDTNMWEAETARDLVDCGSLHKGVYHINPSIGGLPASPSPSPVCLSPQAPTGVQATKGPGVRQVTLSWDEVEEADYYTVTYGLTSGGYIWGSPNIGKVEQYIVSGLEAGRKYYFVLTTVNDCGSSGYSQEVWGRAGGSLILPSPNPDEEKGGWEPGEVISFSPIPSPFLPEEEATPGALVSPEATPLASPTAFIPPKPEPFWRDWSFWAKVGLLSLVLFLLLVVGSRLKRKLGRPPLPKAPTKPEKEEVEVWPARQADASHAGWPPPATSSVNFESSLGKKRKVPRETLGKEGGLPPFSSKSFSS